MSSRPRDDFLVFAAHVFFQRRHLIFAFVVGMLAKLILVCFLAEFGFGARWWSPKHTFDAPPEVRKHRLSIVSNATRLAYTSTYGSYYNPLEANATIGAGWLRFAEENPQFGMRAIAFAHFESQRLLIAFRGTDLNTESLSGQADLCADSYLFSQNRTLPSFCQQFPESIVDYGTAARLFTLRVQSQLPEFDLMFTGHSLGGGLASMMALFQTEQNTSCIGTGAGAVAFAAPDYLFAMALHSAVNLTEVTVDSEGDRAARILVMADSFDPIFYSAHIRPAKGMIGHLCLWEAKNVSSACLECDTPTNVNWDSVNCFTCLLERHIFGHYEKLALGNELPMCAPVFECPQTPDACKSNPNATC